MKRRISQLRRPGRLVRRWWRGPAHWLLLALLLLLLLTAGAVQALPSLVGSSAGR